MKEEAVKKRRKKEEVSAPPVDSIFVKGARVHNLKNIDVHFPRNKFIVVTGVSGSGKSSLTIDTLFAEGQRRYAESLSAYVRQFLARMDKPDVDYIKGLAPAIAIEQKVITRTPRSTVGSMTEIYDYLRLLFARVGKTISPVSGRVVKKDDVKDVLDAIKVLKEGSKVFILSAFKTHRNREEREELNILMQKGFSRIYVSPFSTTQNENNVKKGAIYSIEDVLSSPDDFTAAFQYPENVYVLIFTEDSAEDKLIKKQSHNRVKDMLDQLPEDQREVIILRHYADMSFKEIAEITNCSINTALGRMRYGLINLRKMMVSKQISL